ncbi:MAG: sugar phosphate isomerase/epimerase [Candidatus Latescibacterota bacterium]|nr:sugar phosphate isomerase/epimerase [Candidatus Latescibacterota bacterium]
MKLGIFNRTFEMSLEQGFQAVAEYGLQSVQFDFITAMSESMPEEVHDDVVTRVVDAVAKAGVEIGAVSGTFNMIDPDLEARERGFRGLQALGGVCPRLGTQLITLCTGTRNPDYLWRHHPDNDTPEAWAEMLVSMERATSIAEETDTILVFETEVNNVVDSAEKARCLMDEIQSPRLQVVMDGANLFHTGQLSRMHEVLDHAFELLGSDIRLAHAKDLEKDGDAGHQAAGTGVLDYAHYLSLLRKVEFEGSLILHSLSADQVTDSVAYVRDRM